MIISSLRHQIELPLPEQERTEPGRNFWGNRVVRIVKFLPAALLASPLLLIAYGIAVTYYALSIPFRVLKLALSILVLIATFFANLGKKGVHVKREVKEVKTNFIKACAAPLKLVGIGLVSPLLIGFIFVLLYRKLTREPYTIYQDGECEYVDVQPPSAELAGIMFFLNVQAIREQRNVKKLTFKDLPEGVDSCGFKRLFDGLNQRLQALSSGEREKVEGYIADSYDLTLRELRKNILDQETIPGLLRLAVNSEDFIENAVFYIYSILKAVQDQSNERVEGSLMSPQEEMLLAVSASIQNCPTGQRDGIVNYYNLLPWEYHYLGRELGEEGKIREAANESVQQAINDTLVSEALLKGLMPGMGIMSRVDDSHVTLYLKNRLYQQIGFNHHLVSDPCDLIVPNDLVYKKTEEMVRIVFNHCTPDKVVGKFKKNMEKIVQESFGALSQFMTPHIEKFPLGKEQEGWKKYVQFDAELYPQGLTDLGAVTILEAVGYLVRGPV